MCIQLLNTETIFIFLQIVKFEIYKSGDNPYSWDRLGWDVLHPPNILKFYALPCELFNSFKLMNLVFYFF